MTNKTIVCPDCNGDGTVEVLDDLQMDSLECGPSEHDEECETCRGEGVIDEECPDCND